MGYDVSERSYIQRVIREEKEHQTDPANVESSLTFARSSFKLGRLAINNAMQILGSRGRTRALEVGAGGGAMSWMMAESGFDVWLCELEPNSLLAGSVYDQHRLPLGRRIVCDARILPFADAEFDMVFCKEFAHHIPDVGSFLSEVNRVLRPGGLFVLIEPLLSLYQRIVFMLHPDPHSDHFYVSMRTYFAQLKRCGFRADRYGLFFYKESGRNRLTSNLKQEFNRDLMASLERSHLLKRIYGAVIGGTLVSYSSKERAVTGSKQVREIEVIPVKALTLTDEDLQSLSGFRDILVAANDQYDLRKHIG
jgi:ubiquinone/menaquinone biosynthesis C-methylase UbiE